MRKMEPILTQDVIINQWAQNQDTGLPQLKIVYQTLPMNFSTREYVADTRGEIQDANDPHPNHTLLAVVFAFLPL